MTVTVLEGRRLMAMSDGSLYNGAEFVIQVLKWESIELMQSAKQVAMKLNRNGTRSGGVELAVRVPRSLQQRIHQQDPVQKEGLRHDARDHHRQGGRVHENTDDNTTRVNADRMSR